MRLVKKKGGKVFQAQGRAQSQGHDYILRTLDWHSLPEPREKYEEEEGLWELVWDVCSVGCLK